MAKIPQNLREKAAAAGESWGQFKLLAPGLYAATLDEVDATRTGPAGAYWMWTFKYDNQPGKAFHNTSFSDKAIGSVGATYRAFDADMDVDTDELIGDPVILAITVEKVKKGERKGQLRNVVAAVLPWEDGFVDVEQGEVPDASELSDGDDGDEESGNGQAPAAAKAAPAQVRGRKRGAATVDAKDWE